MGKNGEQAARHGLILEHSKASNALQGDAHTGEAAPCGAIARPFRPGPCQTQEGKEILPKLIWVQQSR
jgi:hypothetical protein